VDFSIILRVIPR